MRANCSDECASGWWWFDTELSNADTMHCREEKRLAVPAESIAALNARATLQCDSSPLPGELKPEEIRQGNIGDCWLLSAIAALGAHDPRAIRHLFRDDGSCCTVRLFDLHDWSPRDVSNVGASAPSDSLAPIVCAAPRWVALLEQAVAIHCGGYAMLNGGQPPRAWAILTGYKPQYTIKLDPATKRYQIGGWLNPNQSGSWEAPGNSAHSKLGFRGLWPMEWPATGGGGQRGTTIDRSELFARMCVWNGTNFAMCAASNEGPHAFTVLRVCGAEDGGWVQLFDPLGTTLNGLDGKAYGKFWLASNTFFAKYESIYLCAGVYGRDFGISREPTPATPDDRS